jgi:hypothetical protein
LDPATTRNARELGLIDKEEVDAIVSETWTTVAVVVDGDVIETVPM